MFNAETIQSLNDLELEVYNYVIRQPEKVQYMRIREFAEEAHVSTSTVLRFCKRSDAMDTQSSSSNFGSI